MIAASRDAASRGRLRVLSVAYPFAPVGPDAVGGAEQVLALLDEQLVARGHVSRVVACAGSQVAGTLLALPPPAARIDEAERRHVHALCRARIAEALARWPIDLVHLHGLDFDAYLPPAGPALLATLHLPLAWYDPRVFTLRRPRTLYACLSEPQRRSCPPGVEVVVVPNGVELSRFCGRRHKAGFALALGRICPEKGFDRVLDAAHRARIPLLIGGAVFGYPEHQRHFEQEIAPRLDGARRFVGPLAFARKRRLLAAARCLLIGSRADETSSLVAMEALASGTPVVAFRAGALPEIVEHGRTGFIVDSVEQMAAAIAAVGELDPAACRGAAEARFSAERTIERYLALYAHLGCG